MKHPSSAERRDTGEITDLRGIAMISFYREHNGDYLAIDTATNAYYLDVLAKDYFEGRATAIAGLVGSVCTTGISRGFLGTTCRRVARAKVPAEWRRAI